MAEFYLYTDESGKLESNLDFTAFCGYIAHESEWGRLNQEWMNARLAWDVPAIHMAEIRFPDKKPNGEWAKKKVDWGDTWDKRCDQLLRDFATLVTQSHAACVGNVVDAYHFRKMPDSPFKQTMNNPLYLSLYNTIMDSFDMIERLTGRASSLSIVFDEDEQYAMKCYEMLSQLRREFPSRVGKRLDAICFGNDKAYPGIQAADMIAYESRSLMWERKNKGEGSPPSELYTLLTRGGVQQPTLYTPHFLDILQNTWTPPTT